MGLILGIYRRTSPGFTPHRSCAFKDVSEITIVNVDGPFDPKPDRPAALLVAGPRGHPLVVPAVKDASGAWVPVPGLRMMGGDFVSTSDSRWSEAVSKKAGVDWYGAVPLHDLLATEDDLKALDD